MVPFAFYTDAFNIQPDKSECIFYTFNIVAILIECAENFRSVGLLNVSIHANGNIFDPNGYTNEHLPVKA